MNQSRKSKYNRDDEMQSQTMMANRWESTGMHILNIFSLDKQIKGDKTNRKSSIPPRGNKMEQLWPFIEYIGTNTDQLTVNGHDSC